MSAQPSDWKDQVKETYGQIARTRNTEQKKPCCSSRSLPRDYSDEEIATVPPGAYLGEGSGNPVRAARLKPGEVVVDLGCGAGMDVFLAANQVGPTGRVLGFDMTADMLARARRSLEGADYPQVEFHEAEIDRLPLPDGFADVVLSNCVINLASDKAAVYREIFRVLKPGGRIAVSDIVLRGDPETMRAILEQLPACTCVTHALPEHRYMQFVTSAGLEDVRVVAQRSAMEQTQVQEFAEQLRQDPSLVDSSLAVMLGKSDPQDWGVSAEAVTLTGSKPSAA